MRVTALVLFVALVGCKVKKSAVDVDDRRARAREAERKLHAMGKVVRLYFAENNILPKGHAPLTPAAPCCTHPGAMCDPLEEDGTWDREPWDTLDFVFDEKHRFQFDYESDGKTFLAHAVGDLDCKGDVVTFTLAGHPVDGELVLEFDDPVKADKKSAAAQP